MNLRLCFALLCVALLAPILASATGPASLDGLWKGPLRVPGGQWEMVFRLVRLSRGQYFATLDVPQQRVSRMAVQVEVRGDTVLLLAEEAASRFTGRLTADGHQLSGQWRQPGLHVPLTLQYSPPALSGEGKVRLTPPYREEEVVVPSSVASLAGMLTVPPGKGPFPAAVLLADAGAIDRDATVGEYRPMGALADYLTRRGVAVLRCDTHLASTGAPALPERLSAALAALNYLRTRPEIDGARLGFIGHGEGGNVALLAAAQPLPPAFVITLAASGLPGAEALVQQQAGLLRAFGTDEAGVEAAVTRQRALLDIVREIRDDQQAQAIVRNMLQQHNASLDPAAAQNSAAELTSPRYRALLTFNPTIQLGAVQCPVLLLHGAADISTAPDANLPPLLKGLRPNGRVSSKKLPGVNHLFQADPAEWPIVSGQPRETFSPQAQETIRAWIVQLRP